jgi:hypothetical protein
MSYWGYLVHDPFLWAAVAGFGVGGALAAATRIPRRAADPDRAGAWKWTAVPLWLSITVVAAAAGMLIPEPGAMLNLALLPVAGVVAGVSAFIVRFPRVIGIPLVVVFAGIGVVTTLLMQPFQPLRGETVLGSVEVLNATPELMQLEVDEPFSASSRFVAVPGRSLSVRATRLEFPRELFFIGAAAGVRLSGIVGTAPEVATAGGDGAEGDGVQSLWRYEPPTEGPLRHAVRVPGVNVSEATSDPVVTNILRTYLIVALPDGTVELRRRSP